MSKEYRVALDIFLHESFHISAGTEKEAIEMAKSLASGNYPGADLTVFETEDLSVDEPVEAKDGE